MSVINTAAVDKIANAAIRAWRTPGAAVAIVAGDEVYIQGYGVKEIGTDDPVTPDTLFALASVSKAFTTTAMAMLVDEGKLSWDDHPRKHVPFFGVSDPLIDASVTLRDLVSHRSGMPRHDWLWYGSGWNRKEMVRRYGLAKSSTPLRSTYEYANLPFVIAGLAVGAASGGSWEEFVRSRLFDALGMTTANFSVNVTQNSPDHASPHEKHKRQLTVVPWCNLDECRPCGGINASARDMSRWIKFQLGNGEIDGTRLLSAEKLLETRKPVVVVPVENPDKHGFDSGINISSYCLGWGVNDYRGYFCVSHGGLIDGFTSQLTMVPASGLGIIVLTNTNDSPIANVISKCLLDLMLSLPRRNWNADYRAQRKAQAEEAKKKKDEEKEKGPKRHLRTKPSHDLEAYVGDYEDPAYGTLTIARHNGALELTYHVIRSAQFAHYHFDTFTGKVEQPGLNVKLKGTFTLDADGNIAALNMGEPFAVEFKKVKATSS